MTLAGVLGAAVATWFVACAALALWAGRRPEADERHPVHTDDGWLLTLHRYRPAADAARRPVPIVLGHGINMNRTCWELSAAGSLPRALAARGHDVFVAEYRGTHSSRPPRRSDRKGTGRWDYDLADHARHDFPAIIEAACRISGADKVNWIGHSMGGILIYLYTAFYGSDTLNRVVTLGSPVRFAPFRGAAGKALDGVSRLLEVRPRLHLTGPTVLALPLLAVVPGWLLRWSTNPRHLTVREILTLSRGSFEDVSSGVTGFFVQLNRSRRDVCPDASEERDGVEVDGLRRMQAPLLVVAGDRDGLAPPRAVEPAYRRAASPEAAYLRLGDPDAPADAATPRFGHADLISGQACLEHVLPVLTAWLEPEQPTISYATMQRSDGVDGRRAG